MHYDHVSQFSGDIKVNLLNPTSKVKSQLKLSKEMTLLLIKVFRESFYICIQEFNEKVGSQSASKEKNLQVLKPARSLH